VKQRDNDEDGIVERPDGSLKRRGNGEGSIVKRPDGRWVGMVSIGRGDDGKRPRKQMYGRRRKDVQRELNKFLHDRDRGLPTPTKSQTVDAYLKHWLESTKTAVRPRTWEKFESVCRLHLIPGVGTYRLEKLQPQHVQDLLTRKSAAGLSPQSVRHLRTILGIALNRAMKWSLVGRNVAALTDPPKFDRPQVVPLTPDEVARLRKAAVEHRLQALLELQIGLGLRRGEALGLTWSDVYLDTGILRVNQSLQRTQGKLQLLPLKTPSSRRTIEIPEIVIKALRKHEYHQKQQRLAAGAEWKDTNLVFTTATGGASEPRNVVRSFKKLLTKAGIPAKRFHDLRHTCATMLLHDGAPVKDVSAILGHARASMTLDIYSHVMPGAGGKAAARMDRLLSSL
jgi:integrase